MANCLRCGKPLEKDGFCMNCMDFSSEDDNIQKSSNGNDDSNQTKPYADDYARIDKNTQRQQMEMNVVNKVNQDMNRQSKSIVIKRFFAYIVMILGLCVIGICLILNHNKKSRKLNIKSETEVSANNTNIDEANKNINEAEQETMKETNETKDSDDDTVYEADYDEIMKAGQPSNIYNLFKALKDEVAPVMEDYFNDQGVKTTVSSDMSNTYMIVDDEKYTDYRSYKMWSYGKDQKEQYLLFYDTVTDQLLHVDVYSKTKDQAIEMVLKSLSAIDPSISEAELDQVGSELNKDQSIDITTGEYEIYGNNTDDSDTYYFIIESMVDHRKE